MHHRIRPMTRRPAATTAVAVFALGLLATQAGAQERPGRYQMSPVDGGFARLDTETGAISICRGAKDAPAAQWNCQPMGDGGADAQLRKLEAENKELRAEIRRMEDQLGLNGDKSRNGEKHAEERPRGFDLPSEQDVDKALSYMERMIKKFHDAMKRLEGATKGGEGGSKGI